MGIFAGSCRRLLQKITGRAAETVKKRCTAFSEFRNHHRKLQKQRRCAEASRTGKRVLPADDKRLFRKA